MVAAHKMRRAKVSQISAGTCSYALPCALDWLLQPVLLQPHRVAVPFPPTFASPWRNSFVQIHGGTTLLKAKFGTTPQKLPKNDLNWGLGSSYGTNKPPLPNPSFPYEVGALAESPGLFIPRDNSFMIKLDHNRSCPWV